MNAATEELRATAARLKREMAAEPVDNRSARYEFHNDGPWIPTLRRLPFTCLLWRRFREYDEARRAYEAAQAARQAIQQELSELSRRVPEAARDTTIDDDTWGRLESRGRRLELALKDEHNLVVDLKTNWLRTEERWGEMWSEYTANERYIAHQQARTVQGPYDDRAHTLPPLMDKKREYEAPRGE